MTEREKMIDLIINAKRTDPETESCTEYLADFLLGYGIKLPDPTPQPGNPLTLEQLREMDGQPVWVEFIGHPDGTPIEPLWMLVNSREKRLVTDVEYVDWNSEGWFAYSYPPAHIDRSKWISVKERLPDFGIPVLICWDGYTDIAEYWCGMVCPKWRTQHYGTVNLTSVTHWMPLPEPPEEG